MKISDDSIFVLGIVKEFIDASEIKKAANLIQNWEKIVVGIIEIYMEFKIKNNSDSGIDMHISIIRKEN